MDQQHEISDKSAFAIAYMLVALSGAFMGFWIGVFVGWCWWA